MSAAPSATETARLRLLVAAEERRKVRELEDAKEAAALAREMRLIDEAERAERERIRAAEAKQRELERLEAEKQAQAVIRVNKRKASALDDGPVAGGSGSVVSVSNIFLYF